MNQVHNIYMEQFENYESNLNLEKFKPEFRMQVELAIRFYGLHKESLTKAELDPYVLKWVEYNEHEFPRNFRAVLKKKPDVLSLYETSPEEALHQMEEALYHKQESNR